MGLRDIHVVIDVDTTGGESVSGVYFMRFDVLNTRDVPMQIKYQVFSFDAAALERIIHATTQKSLRVLKVTSDEGWVRLRSVVRVAGSSSSFTRHRQRDFLEANRLEESPTVICP
ncbi:MAG: hypothetical protein GY811_22365 [Myxococcales bacterium]|nr:hypothetical protein [Myxococcales bacterium]